jgi:hypothetical protein
MGGGDLNLKKSWHTQTLQNIEKVWKVEQQAEEERRKTEILKKEKEKERQLEELQRTYEDAGFKKRVERLDWMYQGPAGHARDINEEYLLGKRRVDEKLGQGTINMNEEVVGVGASETPAGLSQRELMMKLREDPLLTIRKKEVQVVEETLQNPLKLKQIREARHRLENQPDGVLSDNQGRKADPKDPSNSSAHRQKYSGSSRSRSREREGRRRDRSISPSTNGRDSERSGFRHHRHHHYHRDKDHIHADDHRTASNTSLPRKETTKEKLRAMREDAEWNEQKRNERLRQREEQEKRVFEEEEVARKSINGCVENATFIEKLHRQAYGSYATDSIGDRIKRNIHYVQKNVTMATTTSHPSDDRHQ